MLVLHLKTSQLLISKQGNATSNVHGCVFVRTRILFIWVYHVDMFGFIAIYVRAWKNTYGVDFGCCFT